MELNDAAEHLNSVLDAARNDGLSLTERLLEIEVEAIEARRLAGRLRFACLPGPWRIADFDFSAQPGVDEKLVRDLATIRTAVNRSASSPCSPPGPLDDALAQVPEPHRYDAPILVRPDIAGCTRRYSRTSAPWPDGV